MHTGQNIDDMRLDPTDGSVTHKLSLFNSAAM